MSTVWLKNFLGVRQTDYELLQVSRPGTELAIHVTFRCVQSGVILGSLIGPLTAALMENNPGRERLKHSMVSGALWGAGVGCVLGPTITAANVKGMSMPKLYNKVYRLRFDSSRLFVDRSSIIGAALGYATYGSLGFVVGVDIAMVAAVILGQIWQ